VFSLCRDGQRRCRTAAWVVGRCGHGRRQCRTAAAVVGRCGHGQQRYRTAAAVVRRRGHDRWRCRQCRRGAHGPPFPQNPAPMSDTTPTRSARHPLHRHPREGGDPGLPPCEDRRQNGHRPGGRERRRADRAVVTSGHRSFLWRPTWIPAFAGMTVFLLCRDGRRWCRTGALVVGRCGHGQRRCRTAAAVVGRCGHGQRRCRTAAAVVGRYGHGQRRCRTAALVVGRCGHGKRRCRTAAVAVGRCRHGRWRHPAVTPPAGAGS
jgi:hypothetical protein